MPTSLHGSTSQGAIARDLEPTRVTNTVGCLKNWYLWCVSELCLHIYGAVLIIDKIQDSRITLEIGMYILTLFQSKDNKIIWCVIL